MAKVQVLPDILAHKIAAGEVVERPASVAKELLENSLDAGSRKISVEALDGGRKRIQVRDDGEGMGEEDARLAFQRHATSKISTFEDLDTISTLGFRGEALPAIASVARLRLRSIAKEAAGESPLGIEIEYEGGQRKSDRRITWPIGTEVCVEDLFFNVPARKKFLKSASAELGHLSRLIQHYALAYPEVELSFKHQDRTVFQAPAVPGLSDRVHQLLGDSFLESLVPVEYEKAGVRVHGFTSLPHKQKSNRTSQYFYVNRRMVRDRVLLHAVRLAYRDLMPSSSHPVLILFVELSPQLLDVNVHPAKTEIRFRKSDFVHGAVYHGIEEALLGHGGRLDRLGDSVPADRLDSFPGGAYQGRVRRSVDGFLRRQRSIPALFPPTGGDEGAFGGFGAVGTEASTPAPPQVGGEDDPFVPSSSSAHSDDIPETAHLSTTPVILGQFVESFVVVVDRDAVMLVDQHVAHERILYERSLKEMRQHPSGCPTQRLLVPRTVELSSQQKLALEGIMEELNGNGFEVEWFGENTIVIKGTPHFLKDPEADRIVEGILDDLSQGRRDADGSGRIVERLQQEIAISLSCRAAIKINTPLSTEKMQWLVDELFQCANPYTCPHGRPIIIRMNIEDILKRFKRI